MRARKFILRPDNGGACTKAVAETAAKLDWRPENSQGGQPPQRGFFSSVHLVPASMVGPWWGSVRARRFPWVPVRQLCHVPGHLNWRWQSGAYQPKQVALCAKSLLVLSKRHPC